MVLLVSTLVELVRALSSALVLGSSATCALTRSITGCLTLGLFRNSIELTGQNLVLLLLDCVTDLSNLDCIF